MGIVVAGEALVDLAPRDGLLLPLPGGSPFNVAVGLGRLGTETSYLGGLSDDGFGEHLLERLVEDGVDVSLAPRLPEPTTLAVVHLDDAGRATYGFYLAGTAAAALDADLLPPLPPEAALHVSFGALTPLTRPAGAALAGLLRREAGRRLVSLDPNVRPAVIDDVAAHTRELETLVSEVDVVKVSEDDLLAVAPDDTPLATAARWSESGPALVVVTLGDRGAIALTSDGRRVEVTGVPVEVVDTVGAGDAFTAGLLSWLDRHGQLDRGDVQALSAAQLTRALEHAGRVAALTCTRAGADPPRAAEL